MPFNPDDLATAEAQDAFVAAAFASQHPLLVVLAVETVQKVRDAAGIPDDRSWRTTVALASMIEDTERSITGILSAEQQMRLGSAMMEAERLLMKTGPAQTDGPSTGDCDHK